MNFKTIALMSIGLVVILSSMGMIYAADAGNITAADDGIADELQLAADGNESIDSAEIEEAKDSRNDDNTISEKSSEVLGESENETSPAITLYDNGKYFGDKTITVKLVDSNTNKSIAGATVHLKASNGKTKNVVTDSRGIATAKVPFDPGTYTITATYKSASASNTNVKIEKAPAKIIAKKQSMYYGAKNFKVSVINTVINKPIAGVKLLLKVGHGKYIKKFYVTTDSWGNAYYNGADLKAGKHNVQVKYYKNHVTGKGKKTIWTIKKTKAKIKAKKLKVKKGENRYFKVKITRAGKGLHSVRIKIELTKGKKTKVFHKRSDKNGYAKINTKKLTLGKYKVHITCKTSSIRAKEVNSKIRVIR